MSGMTPTGNNTGGVVNPYIRAYKAGGSGVRTTHRGNSDGPLPAILGLPVLWARRLTDHQLRKRIHASQHAPAASLGCSFSLDIGAAAFETTIAPTMRDLLVHSQRDYTHPHTFPSSHTIPSCSLSVAHATPGARALVSKEHTELVNRGEYGPVPRDKLNDVVCLIYENFSSLCMFAEGALCHKKIQQLNKLLWDYGGNLLVGCETRTDWRFITKEEDQFGNLFGDGSPTRGIAASNINDDKIRRDQWGGTCIIAAGRFSSFVTKVGADTTGLGQ